ncbi:MAG: 5'-methylthioadenosine/S-adenosylhomocysteine nucleosidase [Spirochaetaceae bacterium 4572_59]|nr:MAG: 5'-methylthioadenosine/S-adenosylhomocysteine nucleosidase [Spirochaetaceae bacterium 4572_59]
MKIQVGIIAAMEEECKGLIKLMQDRRETQMGAYSFHTGLLEGKSVCLLQCGIGKVNAAVGTALMIHTWHPASILNTGVAGGFLSSLKIGDIVLSTEVLHHDVDVTIFDYKIGQLPGEPESYKADKDLLRKASALSPRDPAIHLIPGKIASGDIFVHKDEQIQKIRKDFSDVTAVEMESAAIAQVCHSFKTPFLIIRAISDVTGDEENHVSYDEFMPIAAKNSIDMVQKILKQ